MQRIDQVYHNQLKANKLLIKLASKKPISKDYYKIFIYRRFLESLFCALIIFGGNTFLVANNFFLPIWPSMGVAMAAILLRGPYVIFGIFLGFYLSFSKILAIDLNFILCSSICTVIILTRIIGLKTIGSIAPLKSRIILIKFLILLLLSASILSLIFNFVLFNNIFTIIGIFNGFVFLAPFAIMLDSNILQKPKLFENYNWIISAGLILAGYAGLFLINDLKLILGLNLGLSIILIIFSYYYKKIATGFLLLAISTVLITAANTPPSMFNPNVASNALVWLLLTTSFGAVVSLVVSCKRD